MNRIIRDRLALSVVAVLWCAASAQTVDVTNTKNLVLGSADASITQYHGRRALKLVGHPAADGSLLDSIAALRGVEIKNGTIEADVAGTPTPGAPEGARGFIGIAFRVASPGGKPQYEYFYVRPTNGRADDQLRRNHSTQYASHPDFPWERLRKESPGVYESYADMETGEWTHLKIVVQGRDARLYVNNAAQPTLIVHDLKLGEASGGVALWIAASTEGYFSGLQVHKTD
jgi:hypothetical protein